MTFDPVSCCSVKALNLCSWGGLKLSRDNGYPKRKFVVLFSPSSQTVMQYIIRSRQFPSGYFPTNIHPLFYHLPLEYGTESIVKSLLVLQSKGLIICGIKDMIGSYSQQTFSSVITCVIVLLFFFFQVISE
jgi:hypothetical protein